jgi:voltage-gated potassium channel
MKYMTSQLMYMVGKKGNKRNLGFLARFFAILILMVTVFSVLFHIIMEREGQDHSWITGFYWTLTVMTTLGFGDITFNSDVGRIFSIFVLMSGIIYLLVLFPFTFIQFFYAPWIEAQEAMRTPRRLPASTQGHVILTNDDPVSRSLIRKLEKFNYEYVVLVEDTEHATRLIDEGIRSVIGEVASPETFRNVNVDRAALVVTTHGDMANTNISFTVRDMAPDVPIVATCDHANAVDVIELAGATTVLRLGEMMGQAFARCTVGGDAVTHVVGNVDELLIAEANTTRTPLVGKTLREARLTELGVSVVAVWDRGECSYATPDTVIGDHAILVMAGSAEQFRKYDERYIIYNYSGKPVVILGGGRVGRAAVRALAGRGIQACIVELLADRVPDDMNSVIGDAADLEVLTAAGLMQAPSVLITTRDDSLNIYLTIYCRRLCPDIQIISRCTLERNTATLHRAGADFVFSYSSMGATNMFNLIKRSRIVTISEGLEIIRTEVAEGLAGKTIAESRVREKTGCTIVAVRDDSTNLLINPRPDTLLESGHELILFGDVESEEHFLERFGGN